MLELALDLLSGRDVVRVDHDAGDGRVVQQVGAAKLDPEGRIVRGPDPDLAGHRQTGLADRVEEEDLGERAVLVEHDRHAVRADHRAG